MAERRLFEELLPLRTRALHLFVLSSLLLGHSVLGTLDVLFFVSHGYRLPEMVLLIAALMLAPGAVMLLLEWLVERFSPRTAWVLHVLFVAGTVGLGLSSGLAGPGGSGGRVLAAPGAVLAGALYARVGAVRTAVTVMTPLPVLALVAFLLFSPVGHLLLGGGDEPRTYRVPARAPVVVVLLDELPLASLLDEHGGIDAQRYPSFARLARRSTWFRNAMGVHDQTVQAIPSIMTGSRSASDSIPLARDHPGSVFTLLAGSHELHVDEPYTDVCPRSLCPEAPRDSLPGRFTDLAGNVARHAARQFLPGRLTTWLPPAEEFDRLDPDAQVDRFVKGISAGPRPALHLLHLLLPHRPWRFLPSGREYTEHGVEIGLVGTDTLASDPRTLAQRWQRHLLQLEYTDRLLGRVLDRLDETGLWRRAAVVVVADHGVAFAPPGDRVRRLTERNAGGIASVPLFVHAPGQRRPARSLKFVQTVDVLPTIGALLGVELPFQTEGRSVLDPAFAGRQELRVVRADAAELTLPVGRVVRQRAAILRDKLESFGSTRERVERFGPMPELLGQPLAALELLPDEAAEVSIDQASELESVDPRSRRLPVYITGELDGELASPGRPIAIALNGRIAATTWVHEQSDRHGFAAIVPVSALRPGRNEVTVYAVARGGGQRLLRRLGAVRH